MLRLRDLAPWALLALAVAFAPSALGPTGTSLALAATAALGAALGGLLWAVGAAHAGRAAPLLRGLAWAALLIPPYLSAVGLIELCGPAGRLPRALGWVDGPLPTAQGAIYESWRISGLTLAGAWLPLVGLAVEAAWRRLDPRAVDAARLVGGRFGEWGLRLSVARAPAGVGALAVGIASLGEFATAQLLRVPVLAEAVHLEAHAPLQAAWHSLPLLIAGLVGLGGCLAIARRPLPSAGGARVAPPGWGGWLLAVLGALALLVLGLGLPVGFLLTRLGSRPGSPGIWASALAALDDTWVFARRDVTYTGGVAAVTATWVTALALLAVSWTRDTARPWHLALLVPAVLLAATPAPLIGIAVLELGSAGPWTALRDSAFAVSVTWALRFAAWPLLVLWLSARRLPRAPRLAAALAPRGRLVRWARIELPQLAPALVLAWGLVYALSVGEYEATLLVSPPGQAYLAVTVVNEAHYGQGHILVGFVTLQLLVLAAPAALALPLGLAWRLRRRGGGFSEIGTAARRSARRP